MNAAASNAQGVEGPSPVVPRISLTTLICIGAPSLLIAVALATPGFISVPSLTSLLTAISFVGCVACGMTLITISGYVMSFSLGVTVAGASIVFAEVYAAAGLTLAIASALITGAFLSGVQGLVIGWFRANPIIVSIAALALIHGGLQAATAGISSYIPPGPALEILKAKFIGLPIEFIVFVALVAAAQLVLTFTAFGRNLFMLGDSAAAAAALGISSWRNTTGAYAFAGAAAAIPGILLAARFGLGSMSYGWGYDYSAIAAILIGGTAIQGGGGSVVQTSLGVAFIALVQNLLVLHGAREEWQVFGLGIMVLAVIILQARGSASAAIAGSATTLVRTRNSRRSFVLLAFTVVLLIVLDFGQGRVLSAATAFTSLQQFATIGPVALGLGLTMIIGEFDLSVAGMFGLAGCIAVITGSDHPAVGLLAAALTGAIGGAAQGLIITRLRLGSISVTLGGLLLFVGISFVLTESHSISFDNIGVALAVDTPIAGIFSLRSVVAVVLFAVAAVIMGVTRIGRDIVAIGSDHRAAIFSGVNVDWLVVGTFMVSGVLAALSGALLSYGLASASPSGLTDVLVPAAAAAIVGGVSLSGGVGRPLGIAAGVLSLAILRSGLNALGTPPSVHDIITGAILLGVAIIDGGTLSRHMANVVRWRAVAQVK